MSGLLESEDVAWFRDDLTGARLAASRLAERIGLGKHRSGEVTLAVSEAASNLAKHAVRGAILLRVVRAAQHAGIEFLALDDGPGIADVPSSMRDGYSTAGTMGVGLGMIARLSDAFDLHSIPRQGTVMLARFWPRSSPGRPADLGAVTTNPVVEGVTRTISGGQECGDGWATRWDTAPYAPDGTAETMRSGHDRSTAGRTTSTGQAVLVMLCDGVGHGPLARKAAQAAIRAFHTSPAGAPADVMKDIHHGLAATRGAAVAVARIEPDQKRVLFCGVGNIAATTVTATAKNSLPSVPGTAGHQTRTLRTITSELPAGSALVLHSDGLSERWNPQDLPGLLDHRPGVIAGHLLRSAGKYHDDASVAVAKGLW
ncbi:ATP-binding SpoIIE family protein phosphatase [Streptomyces sp. NPDC059980]|uniref:ATP-binding SpoIIE family protein phosphatase n=1 Tax=Streptomyces sp. NPDC059980 TaxID=3347022 RepID=UPI0036B37EA7